MFLHCGRRWSDGNLGLSQAQKLQEGVREGISERKESDVPVHSVVFGLRVTSFGHMCFAGRAFVLRYLHFSGCANISGQEPDSLGN